MSSLRWLWSRSILSRPPASSIAVAMYSASGPACLRMLANPSKMTCIIYDTEGGGEGGEHREAKGTGPAMTHCAVLAVEETAHGRNRSLGNKVAHLGEEEGKKEEEGEEEGEKEH